MRSTKRTTLLQSFASPDLRRNYTTLRRTSSIHFLWPRNRKFSGLLVRSWISSAVADGTVFAWLSWPVFECVQSVSGPRRCYTEVLEAAHPLHRGHHKRSVGWLLSLPEVYSQLFSLLKFRERQLSWHHDVSLYLIQVCCLIIVGNEAQNHSIISKFNNRSGAVRGHTVMCVDRVEQGLRSQDTTLWGSYVQGDGVGGELAHFTTWGLPVRKSWIQSQSDEFRQRSVSLTASLMGTVVLKSNVRLEC